MMKKYKTSSKFVLRKIMDEYIFVPVESGGAICHSIIMANETAVFIWNFLSEKAAGKDEIVKAITDEYEVSDAVAEKDVEAFLSKMLSSELLCLE